MIQTKGEISLRFGGDFTLNVLSALAGMSLAFLLESLDEVQYGVKVSSEVENLMTSVERSDGVHKIGRRARIQHSGPPT